VMGSGEIELQPEGTLDGGVAMELGAVIGRDGAEALGVALGQASIAAGRCGTTANSRSSLLAACKQMSCLVSDQSIPTKAAHATSGGGVMTHLPQW